jgi:hypothetical protein
MLWEDSTRKLIGFSQISIAEPIKDNLAVDSENAFGTEKLYESVGFEHFRTNTAYVKHL